MLSGFDSESMQWSKCKICCLYFAQLPNTCHKSSPLGNANEYLICISDPYQFVAKLLDHIPLSQTRSKHTNRLPPVQHWLVTSLCYPSRRPRARVFQSVQTNRASDTRNQCNDAAPGPAKYETVWFLWGRCIAPAFLFSSVLAGADPREFLTRVYWKTCQNMHRFVSAVLGDVKLIKSFRSL